MAGTSRTSDDQLPDILAEVGGRLARLEQHLLAQLAEPLTYRQYRLLVRINQGHSRPQILRSFANLTMPTLSESVSVLVRRGLVDRSEDPDDRRSIIITITPAGRLALTAAEKALRRAFRNILRDVESPDERRRLEHVLQQIFERTATYFPKPLA